MNADERWFQGHLHELDARQCWESVRSREVGENSPTLQRWPTPWPEGQRSLQLRLTHDVVTGRRLIEA